jgi:hypothetical protein
MREREPNSPADTEDKRRNAAEAERRKQQKSAHDDELPW